MKRIVVFALMIFIATFFVSSGKSMQDSGFDFDILTSPSKEGVNL